ncbi:MAG: hydrolase [Chromatiaceae bacterium]|nr:hydrolase [Chromatiaceae bacterium]
MSEDRTLKCETVYQGRVIDVALETVELPNGRQVELEIIRHPGGAAALALDEQERVCLLRQFRHAAGGWLWELPAGRIEPDEEPLATATRELEEEAGVRAADWIDLGSLHSSPGVFTEVIHLWLARGLEIRPHSQEQDEVIEIHWIALNQALDWCNDGTISDAKTLIGLYRANALLRSALDLMPEDPGC